MKKFVDYLVTFLLVLGGVNWALWGLWEFNLVTYIFGETWIDRLLYILMGAAGIYAAVAWKVLRFGFFRKGK